MKSKIQPLPQTPAPGKSPINWTKILLFIGLAVVAGSVFIGTQIGKNQIPGQQPVVVQPTTSPTAPKPTNNSTVDWETYISSEFAFSVDYPSRFASSAVVSDNSFYLTVADLSSKYNESIKIKVINNVDVYSNAQVVEVARREIIDSGFKYTVTPTKINQYLAAITVINDSTVNSVSVTIQHPRKNIYVVLSLPRDISKVEFEQILTSFKFTD